MLEILTFFTSKANNRELTTKMTNKTFYWFNLSTIYSYALGFFPSQTLSIHSSVLPTVHINVSDGVLILYTILLQFL